MKKYVFKVYTNKSQLEVTLEGLENASLQEMDKFTVENGAYLDLVNTLANKLSIPSEEITRICILSLRKGTEFSIITNNKYLRYFLLNLPNNQEVTPTDIYKEMREYLFENLAPSKSQNFLDNIYDYNNTFRELLSKYAITNKCSQESEENMNHARRLKIEVDESLKKYKNFRSLCICRSRNEEYYHTLIRKTQNLTITPQVLITPNINLNKDLNHSFKSVTERTADFNDESEEFLSPEEYSDAYGMDFDDVDKKY